MLNAKTIGRCAAAACIIGLTAPIPAGAITITPLLEEGDSVPGVGTVTRIDNIALNNNADWIVEADTNNANTDADSVLIRNDNLFLQEGFLINDPTGASIDAFDSVNINVLGNNGFNFFLDNTAGGTSDDSGVYFKTTLLIQESNVSTAPEFSAGTIYVGYFEVKINDNNDMVLMASVDDPNIPSSVDRAIVLLDLDVNGILQSESVLIKEGDTPAGQTQTVEDFETGPHDMALNDSNQVIYIVDMDGSTAIDSAVYIDNTLIAQEGSPSPVAGRNYGSLASGVVDLNNNGSYVFRGLLDGDTSTNTIIISDGAKVVQEGDPITTARGTFAFTSFGTGPVAIADTGDVLWYGDWDDPDTDVDSALFLNDSLLVEEGVTQIDGVPVDTINSGQDAFDISPNGQYVIFEATLLNGTNGAYLITLPVTDCPADLSDPADDVVDVFDLFVLLNNWGTNAAGADLAAPNDVVDVFDLFVLLGDWGPCP